MKLTAKDAKNSKEETINPSAKISRRDAFGTFNLRVSPNGMPSACIPFHGNLCYYPVSASHPLYLVQLKSGFS